jgi:HemK-like putative methylase
VTFSAHDAETALLEAEIPFVRLVGEPVDPAARILLLRRRMARTAERVLEATPWRYRAGHRGLHRLTGPALFTWDGGAAVTLVSGIPAAPLPARSLARLEDRLWRGARPGRDGALEPAPADALLVAAVQVVRPGFPRPLWRRRLAELEEQEETVGEATTLARELGLAASLALARPAARKRPQARTPRRTLREGVWAAGRRLAGATDSRRIAALLDGAPVVGHAVFRTRFAGVEVDSGEGVFLPVPFSESLLGAGLERIAGVRGPKVVDVGTGCGAVALALATARRDADVHGVDVSRPALRWARRNAGRLGVQSARFHRGSLLEPVSGELRGRVDLVLTNVPYAPPAYRRASWDDMPGTVEGEDQDGLGLPRRLADAAHDVLAPGGWLVAQLAAEQCDAFRSHLTGRGYVEDGVVATRAGDAVVVARVR